MADTGAPPFVIGVFANAILEQDYELAHSCLSNGLQKRLPRTELRETLLEAEEDGGVPSSFSWRRSDMNYADWTGCVESPSAPEVCSDNYLSWSCLTFHTDVEPCYQIWCVLMTEGPEQCIGFFEITDPD